MQKNNPLTQLNNVLCEHCTHQNIFLSVLLIFIAHNFCICLNCRKTKYLSITFRFLKYFCPKFNIKICTIGYTIHYTTNNHGFYIKWIVNEHD